MNIAAERSGPAAYHLIMQVWGDLYTRLLTDVCLPALLSPGNIPALAVDRPTVFRIFTTEPDMARFRESPAYAELTRHVTVEFNSLDAAPDGDKYAAMTDIHRHIVRDAADRNLALIWLVPDSIWADGSLRTVVRAVAAGKRAVMQSAVKVNRSTALPYFEERLAGRSAVAIESRELVQVALDHMHRYYRAWFWDAPKFSRNAANVYWRVDDKGFVLRGFHLHPLMLHPERAVADFVSTFDDDLPLLACPSFEHIYVAADSDEAFHVDLADEDWCPEVLTVPRRSAYNIAMWAAGATNLHHRRLLEARIRVHAGAMDEPAWQAVEQQSDAVVRRVRRWLAVWAACARPLEWVFGLSRTALLDTAAAEGLSPRMHPEPPAWYSALVSRARALHLTRTANALTGVHRFAVRHTLFAVFGKNVVWKGLNLERRYILRLRQRLRIFWWRTVWPALWKRYKRVALFAKRRRRDVRVLRDRTGTRLRRSWHRGGRALRNLPTSWHRWRGVFYRWRRDQWRNRSRSIRRVTKPIDNRLNESGRRLSRWTREWRKGTDKRLRRWRSGKPLKRIVSGGRALVRRARTWNQ